MAFHYEDRPGPSFFRKLLSPAFIVHKVRRVVHNVYWDWRFGGSCAGAVAPLAHLGANGTASLDYEQLALLFTPSRVPIGPSDVLVDIGCGKGRVLNFWLREGHRNRMIGIELNEKVAIPTRDRLRPYPNVTVIPGDALLHIPMDGTIFYLYHTFQRHVMERFKHRLVEMFGRRGQVTLVYCNCHFLNVFEDDPRWSIDLLDWDKSLVFPSAIIRMRDRLNEETISGAG